VINLMEALRQSLERVSDTKKKPAKIGVDRTAHSAAPARKRARG
jgi:hypothetical protein